MYVKTYKELVDKWKFIKDDPDLDRYKLEIKSSNNNIIKYVYLYLYQDFHAITKDKITKSIYIDIHDNDKNYYYKDFIRFRNLKYLLNITINKGTLGIYFSINVENINENELEAEKIISPVYDEILTLYWNK